MAQKIKRVGYGQVEPNHLSARRTGNIYAQLPLNSNIKALENGRFVKYDYANGEVNLTGEGEWMLTLNEIKLYEPRETSKDFALKNTAENVGTPRVMKTIVGDIFTTNCLELDGKKGEAVETTDTYDKGDKLTVDATGYLVKNASPADGEMVWEVAEITTMPDGQDAVKLMRIQ